MDTTTWFHDKLITAIAEIEDERATLARNGVWDPHQTADELAELSHMVRRVADRMHVVASETMSVSDEVRVGAYKSEPQTTDVHRPPLRLVHREELLAEVRNGEHDEVVS